MERRWTDDRMDDLKHQVDELGRRIEVGFAEQRKEMNTRFDRMETYLETRFEQVDKRFEQVDKRFEQVDKRFEKAEDRFEAVGAELNRTQEMVIGLHALMTRLSLTLLVSMVSLVTAQAVLILTQL